MKALKLPDYKTKIVCTIGPASPTETVLEELMRRGMNVARLNFAHGTVKGHREDIRRIRMAAAKLERSCMILADLPGPKIRIGKLTNDPLILKKGDRVTLTTKDVPVTAERISVNYKRLPESVSKGSDISGYDEDYSPEWIMKLIGESELIKTEDKIEIAENTSRGSVDSRDSLKIIRFRPVQGREYVK